MPVSEDFRESVEGFLAAVTPVKMRRMFGGVGIYAGSHFFALIDDDMLYFKVDDTNRPDFEVRGTEQFAPLGPDRPMQYYRVPDGVLRDTALLREWVNKAVAVARRKGSTKARRRKKPR